MRKALAVRKITVLLLLKAPDSKGTEARPVIGMTRLQKLLFLISKEIPRISGDRLLRFDLDFQPNRFGPADVSLYQDLDFLESLGHIRREPAGSPSAPDLPPSYADASETSLSFEYLMADEGTVGDYAVAERGPSEAFAITDKGIDLLQKIDAGLEEKDRKVLDRLKSIAADVRSKYGDWPLERLLRFVYSENPDMITASEIRDRVLGPRGSM